jgi:hypothetical protein
MAYSSIIKERGDLRVSVSTGNEKLYDVPNVSLDFSTCRKNAPCAKECYAKNAYRRFAKTRDAWRENTRAARGDMPFFFECVGDALLRTGARMFRVHVAGDFFSLDYMRAWYAFAREHGETRFLAFTKRYTYASMAENGRPDNFTTVLSAWPGLTVDNPHSLPVAWYGEDARAGFSRQRCGGNCEECGACFTARRGFEVVLAKH